MELRIWDGLKAMKTSCPMMAPSNPRFIQARRLFAYHRAVLGARKSNLTGLRIAK